MTPPVLKLSISSAAIRISAPAWTGWQRSLRHRPGTGRIKGLVWEGDGWLLLYKRLSESSFQWPRNPDEVRSLTPQQFRWLMEGLTITPKKSVRAVEPPEYIG